MKKFILLVIYHLCLLSFLEAQSIHGLIRDGEGERESATVSLRQAADSSIVKFAISGSDGTYRLVDIKEGFYFICISHIGYHTSYSGAFRIKSGDDLKMDFTLAKSTTELQSVSVTNQKPMIEVNNNKLILNVEGTSNSIGSDALELFRKAPGVIVDRDDNIQLNGKNGVIVYVDGRKLQIKGEDLALYLRSIPSAQVQSIEFITNPSSAFDAEGNAGIINIKLKKDHSLGLNGSINAGFNIGRYAKYNSGFSLNYRNKKMNIFGNYNFNHSIDYNSIEQFRTVSDSSFHQTGNIKLANRVHYLKAGMDFFINNNSILGFLANANFTEPVLRNSSQTVISNSVAMMRNRILRVDNERDQEKNYFLFNINYNYSRFGQTLAINADHNIYLTDNLQIQPNFYYDTSGKNMLYHVVSKMIAPARIYISTLKADWSKDYKAARLEGGIKLSFVRSDNDFRRYDISGGSEDPEVHNHFIYRENVNAGYVNYHKSYGSFSLDGGLRAELTAIKGNGSDQYGSSTLSKDSVFKRNYLDLFPSGAINYKWNATFTTGLSFSRRIDRPNYQDLNPFEFKLDEYSLQRGNVNLRPQYTNTVSLNAAWKDELKMSLSYSHVKDLFVVLTDTTELSKSVMEKQNLDEEQIVSFYLAYPFQYKILSIFPSVSATYTSINASYGPGRTIDQHVPIINLYLQASAQLNKILNFDLTTYYNSSDLYQGTFRTRAIWTMDAGLAQNLAKGRLSLRESVSDIFHTLHYRDESYFAGQRTIIFTHFESRQLKLSLSWRFGSNQIKSARDHVNAAEDEHKRAN